MSDHSPEILDVIRSALAQRGLEPRISSTGKLSSRCPTHDDTCPSLWGWIDKSGRPRLQCKANRGCTEEGIFASLGMLPPFKLARNNGRIVATYPYTDENGALLFEVVRFDPKAFRQRRPDGRGGWTWKLDGVRRVLYRLPQVIAAVAGGQTVYVTEGEKDVHAAERAGVVATTNPGGAGKWRPEFSEVLRGAHVVIVADRDEAGRRHAAEVAASLAGVAASVRTVEAAVGKDLADHLAAGRTLDQFVPSQLPAEACSHEALSWRPFPTRTLPEPLRSFVVEAAASLGCDEAMVALPLLGVLAGCVGNRRALRLKEGWVEVSVLWACVVAPSGTLKSPALRVVVEALQQREAAVVERHRQALDSWANGRDAGAHDATPRPRPPSRLVVEDITVEALIAVLSHSPMGLLAVRDELAGHWRGFDRYRNGHGGDAQAWLSIFGAAPVISDRKSSGPVAIPRAAVSIVGGVQPEVLRDVLGQEHFVDGTAARFLFAMPPRQAKKWSDRSIPGALREAFDSVLTRLLAMEPGPGPEGQVVPVVLDLSPDARAAFIAWYDRHAERQNEADGREAAAFAKLEAIVARLALVLHLARIAAGDVAADPRVVDGTSMDSAISIGEWAVGETIRVYRALQESPTDAGRRQLVEMIQQRFSGRVTPRQLHETSRRFRGSGVAEEVLEALVADGLGRWEAVPASPSGGRPQQVFVLKSSTEQAEQGRSQGAVRSGNLTDHAENKGLRTGPPSGPPEQGDGMTPNGHSPPSLMERVVAAEEVLESAIRSNVPADIVESWKALAALTGADNAALVEAEIRQDIRREAGDGGGTAHA